MALTNDQLYAEIQRRAFMWSQYSVLDDGSTILTYDGDPNLVINGNTPGETKLYSMPYGAFYAESNGNLYYKSHAPNSWILIGNSADTNVKIYDWLTATNYYAGDMIIDGTASLLYRAKNNYTSGVSVAADVAALHLEAIGGAGGSTKVGNVYISDVTPTGAGNVGTKTHDSSGQVLTGALTDTDLVTVHVFALPALHDYAPTVTLAWGASSTPVTMTLSANPPIFTGTAAINLAGNYVLTVTHEDGAFNTVTLTHDVQPTILTAHFTGGYPGTQTEVKVGDTYNFNVTTDLAVTAVQFAAFGAYGLQTFPVTSGTTQTVSGIIQATSTAPVEQGAQVRVQKATGSWSAWHDTTLDGTVDGTNVVLCNDITPTVTLGAITYPGAQGALKNAETATVAGTVANYDTVSYTSPNGDLTIAASTTFANPKTVTRNAGTYNTATHNLRLTASRNANATSTFAETVVCIANIATVVTMSLPFARLRSGGNDGTAPQNYAVTLTADQALLVAPTLAIGAEGTWQGAGFTGGPDIWNRNIQITDSMNPGTFSFGSLLATNLAAIDTILVSGSANYVIGGFVPRTITLAAYANTSVFNAYVTTYANFVATWSVKALTRAAIGTPPPVANDYTISALGTNPTTLIVLDLAATGGSSVPTSVIVEETV